MLQATLPEIKLTLSSKSRDLLSHVVSECMQMRGRMQVSVHKKAWMDEEGLFFFLYHFRSI